MLAKAISLKMYQHPMSTKTIHIPELDGLRGVSILLVFLSHAWMHKFIPGGFGVTVFFFISGFIITNLMLREEHDRGSVNLKNFYLRRLFRLMPALSLFLVFCLLALVVNGVEVRLIELASALFFFSNYLSIFEGFNDIGFYSPLSIVWSLSVEEHFYLFWPFIFLFFGWEKKTLARLVVISLFLVLAWRCYLVYGVGLDDLPRYRLYKATDTRFDAILYGVFFALIKNVVSLKEFASNRIVVVVGFGLMLSSFVVRNPEFRESFRYSIQGVGLLLVFHTLLDPKSLFGTILRSAVLQFFGKISYSLYLYHWLVFVLLEYYLDDHSVLLKLSIMLPASVALAWLSYRFVEQPGLRFGRRFIADRNAKSTPAVV